MQLTANCHKQDNSLSSNFFLILEVVLFNLKTQTEHVRRRIRRSKSRKCIGSAELLSNGSAHTLHILRTLSSWNLIIPDRCEKDTNKKRQTLEVLSFPISSNFGEKIKKSNFAKR